MESLRQRSFDATSEEMSAPARSLAVPLISWLLGIVLSAIARSVRSSVWPQGPIVAGLAVRQAVQPVLVKARNQLPPGLWTPRGEETHAYLAFWLQHLQRSWGHLGLPPAPREKRADAPVLLRALAAWSALVDVNLDAVDALTAGLVVSVRRLPALLLPLLTCIFLFVIAPTSAKTFRVAIGFDVQLALIVLCVSSVGIAVGRLRKLVRSTDPRVPVLLTAAYHLDVGHPARLALCAAGSALQPPAVCAYPEDLLAALSDAGHDPRPFAPLMVAGAAPDLDGHPRVELAQLLYRRALEIEHARLSRAVAAWLSRKDLLHIAAAIGIGTVLLVIVVAALHPVLAAYGKC